MIIGRLSKSKVGRVRVCSYSECYLQSSCFASQSELTREVEALGGKVVNKVSNGTTICISDKSELARTHLSPPPIYLCCLFSLEELDKASKRMVEVEECEVPVVGEDYLQDAVKGGALLKIPSHTISSWGAPRHSLPADEPDSGRSFKSRGEPPPEVANYMYQRFLLSYMYLYSATKVLAK